MTMCCGQIHKQFTNSQAAPPQPAEIITSLFVALSLLTAGCAAPSVSPREAFLRAHAAERAKYESIWEVSPESLLGTSEERYSGRLSLVRTLKRDFSKYPDLMAHLDAVRNRLTEFSGLESEYLRELQQEFDVKQDTLFYYVHVDGTDEEAGWMMVRAGEIRKKYILATGKRNLLE